MNGIMIPIVMISAGATIIYGSILVLNGSTFSSLTAALFFSALSSWFLHSYITISHCLFTNTSIIKKIKEGQVTPP